MFVFPLPVSVLIPANTYQRFCYHHTSDNQNICWDLEDFIALCLYHSWFDSFGKILVQSVDVFSFDRYLGSVLKLHLITDKNAESPRSICSAKVTTTWTVDWGLPGTWGWYVTSQTWHRISTRLSIELEQRHLWREAQAGRSLGSESSNKEKCFT